MRYSMVFNYTLLQGGASYPGALSPSVHCDTEYLVVSLKNPKYHGS